MDRFTKIEGQKIVETMDRFSIWKKIEAMDRFAAIEGQKIIETMVRFYSWKKEGNNGLIGYNPRTNNCWNSGQVLKLKKNFKF